MKWIDYRERLGIGFSDNQKAKALANKISSFIESGKINQNYSHKNYFQFCRMVGNKYENIFPAKDYIAHLFEWNSLSVLEIISYYIAFVNSQVDQDEEHHKRLMGVLTIFLNELNIQHEVYHDSDGYFVFPKGIPEFDEELISKPLYWLKDYPNAENAWSKALRSYANRGNDSASDVADKFRKALETFFQEFFTGNKSLENYKSEYGDYLKQRNVPKEIRCNLESALQFYTNYMNNYAKHRDRTSDILLEHLMYQTGNIIRLLIILKQEETTKVD